MNNEKTLEKLYGIAELLPTDERKNFDYYRGSPEILETAKKYADSLSIRLADIIADVEKDLRAETAKKSGNSSRQKAAERIIKNAKKAQPSRPCMHGAWTENGLQCICDSFRVVRLRESLPLENVPEGSETLPASRIIKHGMNTGAELDLPELGELRAHIRMEKARIKAEKKRGAVPLWDFGDDLPAVDAQYLLDILEILPGCTATAARDHAPLRVIYFESEHGDAGLCPVKKEATA